MNRSYHSTVVPMTLATAILRILSGAAPRSAGVGEAWSGVMTMFPVRRDPVRDPEVEALRWRWLAPSGLADGRWWSGLWSGRLP